MPRVTRVKSASKPQGKCSKCDEEIKKGDGYLWWQFAYAGKSKRCLKPACAPRAQDLTRSEWVSRCADFQDDQGALSETDWEDAESLASAIEDLAEQVRDFGSEQQDKLDNMPEGLQQGDTGQLLAERAENMESAADELQEAADTARNAELVEVSDDAAVLEWGKDDFEKGEFSDAEFLEFLQDKAKEHNDSQLQEALDAAQSVSIGD